MIAWTWRCLDEYSKHSLTVTWTLPVSEVKSRFPHLRVGRSVHVLDEAIQAERDGVHYVLYGHCFETNSKKGLSPNGIDTISAMKKELSIPVYAIGGITPARVELLKGSRSRRNSCYVRDFFSKDPRESALQFLTKWRGEISETSL